jgi:GNAT superfamily N-acetyltransferase
VEVDIEQIPPAASYPLRHAVLRPHLTVEQLVFDGDDLPGTATFGAVDRASGEIVGVATMVPETAPFDPAETGIDLGDTGTAPWRLRYMATREDVRGQGVGALVLKAGLAYVAAEGGDLVWCNARVPAVGFYERAGFEVWGEEFLEGAVGPHVVMWRTVETGEAR